MSRKVIIIGSAYPLRGGGISTFNERLAKAFQDNGDEVKIYNFSLQYPGFLFPGKTQYSDEEPPEGLKIVTVINSVNPLNWQKIGKRIRDEMADLVIIRYWIPFMAPCLGTIARKIRKNNHSKIIAITDNIIPHEKRPGDRALTKYFIKPVHGFLVMSSSVMEDLKQFDTEKPRLLSLHPLYDNFGASIPKADARKLLDIKQKRNVLLFFGLIRDYKGLDLLIKSLAQEEVEDLKLRLLVAGEFYDDYEKYRSMVDELGLQKTVKMPNAFIPNADVYKYFCAADLVVQPYKSATQSGVTQVAYHFDKPMVVTNVGALPQMVPDGKVGYVVNPNPQEIAAAIAKYFSEERELEFTRNIREEKKKYSWERFLEAIGELAREM
jgi:glycosyltransferase involved in cell wall biosynthesis